MSQKPATNPAVELDRLVRESISIKQMIDADAAPLNVSFGFNANPDETDSNARARRPICSDKKYVI